MRCVQNFPSSFGGRSEWPFRERARNDDGNQQGIGETAMSHEGCQETSEFPLNNWSQVRLPGSGSDRNGPALDLERLGQVQATEKSLERKYFPVSPLAEGPIGRIGKNALDLRSDRTYGLLDLLPVRAVVLRVGSGTIPAASMELARLVWPPADGIVGGWSGRGRAGRARSGASGPARRGLESQGPGGQSVSWMSMVLDRASTVFLRPEVSGSLYFFGMRDFACCVALRKVSLCRPAPPPASLRTSVISIS